jgi:hypothetical protein
MQKYTQLTYNFKLHRYFAQVQKKITLVLRDMMSELFIVFLVLSSTEYESNYIVFGGIFLILRKRNETCKNIRN